MRSTYRIALTKDVAVNDGQWHHVVATFDWKANGYAREGHFSQIYVDGSPVAVDWPPQLTARGSRNTRSALVIGLPKATPVLEAPSVKAFEGTLDEVMIYNRAMSAQEVKELYQFYTASSAPSASVPSRTLLIEHRTVSLAADPGVLADKDAIIIGAGGTLDLGVATVTTPATVTLRDGGVLAGTGTLRAAAYVVETSATINASLASPGGLVVSGPASVVTLTGQNSFSGGVTVKGGTLQLSSLASAGTGSVIIVSGSTKIDASKTEAGLLTEAKARYIAGDNAGAKDIFQEILRRNGGNQEAAYFLDLISRKPTTVDPRLLITFSALGLTTDTNASLNFNQAGQLASSAPANSLPFPFDDGNTLFAQRSEFLPDKSIRLEGNVRLRSRSRTLTADVIEVSPDHQTLTATGNATVTSDDPATGLRIVLVQRGSRITFRRGSQAVEIENAATTVPALRDLAPSSPAPAPAEPAATAP